jgi:hypothetical protein
VFHNPDALGPQFHQIQKHITPIGEFEDTVQIGKVKKIFKVVRGVDAHFFSQLKTGGVGVDIADAKHMNFQVGKVSRMKQLQKKLTGSPAADNGDVERQFVGYLAVVQMIARHGKYRRWFVCASL